MKAALFIAVLFAVSCFASAAEIRVLPVMDSDGRADVNFPQDVACTALSTEIVHIPSKGQVQILTMAPLAMIDGDRSSGFTLQDAREMTFRISLRAIRRVHMVTITVGSPGGTTMSLQTSSEFIAGDGKRTWEPALENVTLKSPATSFRFRPRSATEVLLTFRQPSTAAPLKPTIYDISLFSQQDVREFTLVPGGEGEGQPTSSNLQTSGARTERADEQAEDGSGAHACEQQLDLGRMSSGARVFHISAAANQETADNMNDDDASTYCTFDSSKCDPVIIMDLGAKRRVRKASMVVQSQGEMSAYVTNELPWNTPQAEKGSGQRAQWAWLPPEMVATMGGVLSDVTTLFAQTTAVGGGGSCQGIQISPAWFSGLKKIGETRVEGLSFMRMKGPVSEGRYMVFHFSPTATMPPLRVYDINVFGDYAPGSFVYALRAPVNSPDAFLRADSRAGAAPAAEGAASQEATTPAATAWKDVTKPEPKPVPAPPPPAS